MRTIIATILLLVSTSPSAWADWHYAKWGMTPKALFAASGGEAKALASGATQVCAFTDGQIPFAYVPQKKIGRFTFEIVFCKDESGKLSSVALEPPGGTYVDVRAALLATYGAPISDGDGDIAVTAWNDKKSGNFVRLIKVIDSAQIEYRALDSGL